MGSLVNQNMETANIVGTSFSYSRVDWEKLDASEYTLVTLVIDQSYSVSPYKDLIEETVKRITEACQKSPKAENLLFRIVLFNDSVGEHHGFKLIDTCKKEHYSDFINPNGTTALFQATEDAIQAQGHYAKDLIDEGYKVNGIIAILTDGWNNVPPNTSVGVKKVIEQVKREETMSSLITILIGINPEENNQIDQALSSFKDEADLTQYESISNTDAKTFGKLAEFMSKSISAQSQNINGSSSSNPISLSI
jgi:uncharacterized protein YegL